MLNRKCKYDHYSFCDIDEPETACDGCEYGRQWLAAYEDESEPDPDIAYDRARDEGRWLTT